MESLRNHGHEREKNPVADSFLDMLRKIRESKYAPGLIQRRQCLTKAFDLAVSSVVFSTEHPDKLRAQIGILSLFRPEEAKVASKFIKAATIVLARRVQQAQATKQP